MRGRRRQLSQSQYQQTHEQTSTSMAPSQDPAPAVASEHPSTSLGVEKTKFLDKIKQEIFNFKKKAVKWGSPLAMWLKPSYAQVLKSQVWTYVLPKVFRRVRGLAAPSKYKIPNITIFKPSAKFLSKIRSFRCLKGHMVRDCRDPFCCSSCNGVGHSSANCHMRLYGKGVAIDQRNIDRSKFTWRRTSETERSERAPRLVIGHNDRRPILQTTSHQ